MNNKICVAVVRKPQGIKGEVKVSVLLDNPELIKKIDKLYLENGEQFNVGRVFNLGQEYGIGFNEFSNPDDTIKIKNKRLYADKDLVRSLIGNDNFFIDDLIGKIAIFEDGSVVGQITDVENYGASDVVFIKSDVYHNLCFANSGNIFVAINENDNTVILNKEQFMKTKVCDEDGGEGNEDWYIDFVPRNVWFAET